MNFISIITNPLIWLLSVIVAGGIGYLFRLSLAQRRVFQEAGKIIVNAFTPELNALIQSNECASLTLTDEAFKIHDSAIRNNIKSLCFLQQFRLNKAWKELAYLPDDKKCKIPFYEQYFSGGSLDDRKKLNPLAICRIQKIISIVS